MLVRSVDPGGQPAVLRTAGGPGGPVLLAAGQRLVGQAGGQQVMMTTGGQQVVRTSAGQQIILQQQPPGQTIIRQAVAAPTVPPANPAVQRVVINQPGVRPGQPGSQVRQSDKW